MTGRVEAVCVVHADVPLGRRGVGDSAIDKRPVTGPVVIGELGLAGDRSRDTKFHGGIDQAVYAYDDAEARRWASELGRDVPPGWFGENLRTSAVAVTDAVVGSRWRVGTTVLEVTIPRNPCGTFARWTGEPRWVRRFTERGDVGAYLKVIEAGSLAAGDTVVVESVPDHGVTVRDLFEGSDVDGLRRLLETPNLAVKVERDVRAALGIRTKS
ncbi:MOSC domain-containing protein [Rhodococcoides kyotonense]|uniref:MOSC domain-containing protein YiiM n=1 Tax=Rhodococcoides kyotonense TaxID=398843 RepID=A0A239E3R2_9NOCA|nr:MOSC domain-containing protein [Rhodococcus kyotonensis]SNS39237.1 MOSC domain-containing protein YiiM [Rhodococcus kyotonensis]